MQVAILLCYQLVIYGITMRKVQEVPLQSIQGLQKLQLNMYPTVLLESDVAILLCFQVCYTVLHMYNSTSDINPVTTEIMDDSHDSPLY